MHILNYLQNAWSVLGKVLIVALFIIAPWAGIEAACSGSSAQLDALIAQHHFSFLFFQWFCLILFFGTAPYVVWDLVQFAPEFEPWDELAYSITRLGRILLGMMICELILCENVFLILLNYWKHH